MPTPPDLSPLHLSLPQDDRDASGRGAELDAARDAYRYSYDKPNIRGLAMTASLPANEKPALAWALAAANAVLGVDRNAAKVNGRPDATALAGLTDAIHDGGLSAGLQAVQRSALDGLARGPVASLSDYAAMFREWPAPADAADYFFDSNFARMRLMGPNPSWLRRVDPGIGLPDDFGVDESHYRAAISAGDSLAAALAEGRLFSCEYRQLLGLTAGSVPVPPAITVDYGKSPEAWDAAYKAREKSYATAGPQKALVAPLALFAVPAGQRALVPVAIQLFPNGQGGQRQRVFTPRDGLDWLAAKACVQAADGTVHETVSHLGLTHVVQEAFCLAVHNCLARRHPLFHLLAPHFEGTQSINAAADQSLVNPGGGVDELLLPTIGGCIALTAAAVKGLDFNASMFPAQLEARGVTGDAIASYPYRDDGQLVWSAIARWVGDYVRHYYASDAAVAGDAELQQLVRQVGQSRVKDAAGRLVGGGIGGVGESGPNGPCVATRNYLVKMLTQIIWNGSAQHAAVNFPQGGAMAYPPLFPLGLMAPAPAAAATSESDYLTLLPHHESARLQIGLLTLLGSVFYTHLGDYSRGPLPVGGYFEGAVQPLATSYQQELAAVERTIEARNQSRLPYVHLLPSRIPQSINI